MTVGLLSISPPTAPGDNLEALRRLLDRRFLDEAGWDPVAEILAPRPAIHCWAFGFAGSTAALGKGCPRTSCA